MRSDFSLNSPSLKKNLNLFLSNHPVRRENCQNIKLGGNMDQLHTFKEKYERIKTF